MPVFHFIPKHTSTKDKKTHASDAKQKQKALPLLSEQEKKSFKVNQNKRVFSGSVYSK